MKRIYIASPYSLGDKPANVRRQIDAYSELMDAGYCAYAPLLSHYIDLLHPRSYVEWMAHDLRWIDVCDAVLRLPGESPGADVEVDYAMTEGKMVFRSIEELRDFWG